MLKENVEIVRAVYERWSEGDLRASVDVFDPQVLLVVPSGFGPDSPEGGTYLGTDAIAAYTREFLFETWADLTMEADEIVAAGECVLESSCGWGIRRSTSALGIPASSANLFLYSWKRSPSSAVLSPGSRLMTAFRLPSSKEPAKRIELDGSWRSRIRQPPGQTAEQGQRGCAAENRDQAAEREARRSRDRGAVGPGDPVLVPAHLPSLRAARWIDPDGNLRPGDDPIYIADQMGHTDPAFTFRVYQKAVKRRERLSGAHLRAFDQALEWARTGTNGATDDLADLPKPALQSQVSR